MSCVLGPDRMGEPDHNLFSIIQNPFTMDSVQITPRNPRIQFALKLKPPAESIVHTLDT